MMATINVSKTVSNNYIRPYVPPGCHPIETGRYLIPTKEIERMEDTVTQWIINRTPGGIIYGRPRIGKTRAINYLMHYLPSEFDGNIPIFQTRCRKYNTPREGIFFENLLVDTGHVMVKGKPD